MTQYIDKSALVAEIDKGINGRNDWQLDEYRKGYHDALTMLKKYLSTFEMKEVDLDTEQRRYLTEHFNVYDDGILQSKKSQLPLSTYDVINVAKHFFELGLSVSNKAEKGE